MQYWYVHYNYQYHKRINGVCVCVRACINGMHCHVYNMYRIAQNFGWVNFWRLVARHTIGGENLANQHNWCVEYCILYRSPLKIWRGKFWLA